MYKRVLIPLDGSPTAETIVPLIAAMAGPMGMDVVLLRVVVSPRPAAPPSARHAVSEPVASRLEEAHHYLGSIANELRGAGIRVETAVRSGGAAVEIGAAAKALGADLIAMSTRGQSGFHYVMFGSVAETVLRETSLPVFLFRGVDTDAARR